MTLNLKFKMEDHVAQLVVVGPGWLNDLGSCRARVAQ